MNKDNLPKYNKSFNNEIKKVENGSSHSFRFQFSGNLYNSLLQNNLSNGLSNIEILKIVSTQLNHHRVDISKYYLNRL